jgi:predicted  nucleic acid-binding Zn-ribbon protein
MIFTCDNCGFIFSRSEETEQCPDCGKYEVRPANETEQEEFSERMAELSRSEHSEAPRTPDIEDAEISMFSSFSFRFPATALQIDSGMIIDVIVEYGENPADRDELAGNVWARQEGGLTTNFLMSVHLPAKQGEAPKEQVNRVFAALNDNDSFKVKLFDFVTGQMAQDAQFNLGEGAS